MKKLVSALVALSVSVCACAEGYASGWYSLSLGDDVVLSEVYIPDGASVSLPDSVSLMPIDGLRPFTAAPGIYTVGVDFPAGEYSVRCAEGESLFNIDVDDENGRSVFNDGFWSDKGEYLGKIKLLDGYTVSIDQGKAYFSDPSGIVFD